MSEYTTGELAKLCGVSVRTVQYYDTRGILIPHDLSEGGRRLYSEDDLKKMRLICFLKELGLSLSAIGSLLSEENPEKVIVLLLKEQEKQLRCEIEARSEQLEVIGSLSKNLGKLTEFSVDTVADIAAQMKTKKRLWKIRLTLFVFGIPLELLTIAAAILWGTLGIWWPFAAAAVLEVVGAVFLSQYYFKNVSYRCPHCEQVFRPRFREAFFAGHTLTTRKLRCPHCDRKSYCVETAEEA